MMKKTVTVIKTNNLKEGLAQAARDIYEQTGERYSVEELLTAITEHDDVEESVDEGREAVGIAGAYAKAHIRACDNFMDHLRSCEACRGGKVGRDHVLRMREAAQDLERALEAFVYAEVALENYITTVKKRVN
jgi:hypothetical protein